MADGRRRVTGAVTALALACAACGSDAEPAKPTAVGPPEQADLRIAAPLNGDELRARLEADRNRVIVRTTVRGTAEPGAQVQVSGPCIELRCRRTVRADARGNWKARVQLAAPVDRSGASVVAEYAARDAFDSDRVTVLLRAPASSASSTTRADRGGGRSASGSGSASSGGAAPPQDELSAAPDSSAAGQGPASPAPSGAAPRRLVMIGDSLAQGTEPYLAGVLSGWKVSTDARRGRPLAEGMRVLSSTSIPRPAVLAFSLFTNDGPGDVAALERAVRASVQRAGAGGCAVWATIVRPPVGGRSYAGANQALERLAGDLDGRLLVVPWADAVRANPRLLAGDGVHATPAGYRSRAQLYADAARACRG